MNRLIDMVCMELDKISETGISSANMDRLLKLSQIKDYLMDSDYKETKKYMMDSTGEYAKDYPEAAKIAPVSDIVHDEYMEAKKNYRFNRNMDCKRTLLNKLEAYMDEFTAEVQDMMKDAECQEERAAIQKYLNKIRDYR